MKIQKISIMLRSITLILLVSILLVPITRGSGAQNLHNPDVRTATIDLSTNMVCGTARKIIKKALYKIDGVIEAEVETADRIAIVTYDDAKTSLAELETAITNAGYDANDKKANPEAYEKLPDCCKIK